MKSLWNFAVNTTKSTPGIKIRLKAMNEHLIINQQNIAIDKDGFLRSLSDWNEAVATEIALRENIILTEAHWEIIHCLRRFYDEFELSPAMRAFVKYIARELGEEKGKSIYLMSLFPQSPAKLASKIAGLPKPTNCL